MWFKNLIVYRLPAPWGVTPAELEAALSKRTLQPCTAFDMQTRGWVPPGPSDRLAHFVSGHFLIALGVEEKVLPTAVIKQVVGERAHELAEEQGYPVGRRQMRELKERVADELRARALSLKRVTRAWIDAVQGWLVVDAGSSGRADELLETLRDCLGSLPARPVETAHTPQSAMAAWLTLGDAPLGFTIEHDLELQSLDKSRATVRYSRHSLDGNEVKQHLQTGKQVARLGLNWRDRIAFVLTEKLQVKRLEYLQVKEQTDGDEQGSAEELFDADFALMAGELSLMLHHLSECLGGLQLMLSDGKAADVDPLYERAVFLVGAGEGGTVTPRHLQNGFSIGYNRACLLLEEMERNGIVGPAGAAGERPIPKAQPRTACTPQSQGPAA